LDKAVSPSHVATDSDAGGAPPLKIDVGRQLFKNSLLIVAARFIAAFAALFCVPFILSSLGMDGYGTWEAMTAFGAFIMILQTPISGTLLWKMSAAYGASDPDEARRLLRLGIGVTLTIFAVCTPIVWLVRYPIIQGFNVPAHLQEAAAELLVFLLGTMILGGINEALGALVSGHQRTGVVVLAQALATTVNYQVSIGALFLGYGLWSLWIGFASSFVLTLAILLALSVRCCGAISLWPVLPTRDDIASMGRYAGLSLVGSFSTGLRIHVDKMILASFASPTWTGYYGIAFRLANLVMEASNFFYTPTLAAAGALHASRNSAGLVQLYSRMMAVVALVTGAVTVLVVSFHNWIMVLWLGRTLPEVPLILAMLITANTVAVVLTGPGTALCKGIGRVGIETTYVTANLVLKLMLMFVLIWWMGAMGTVVASVISWSLAAVFFVFIMHRNLDLPVTATYRAARSLAAVSLTVVVAMASLHYVPLPTSRLQAFCFMAVLAIPVLTVYAIFSLALGVIPLRQLLQYGRSKMPFGRVPVA
jgi:O-antigen/teichoic acid export membrane protein